MLHRILIPMLLCSCLFLMPLAAWANEDLSISISDGPDPVETLEKFSYRVKVRNLTNSTVDNVEIDLPLPPGTQLVGCKTSLDKKHKANLCQGGGGTAAVTLDSLARRRSVRVTLTLIAPDVDDITPMSLTVEARGDGLQEAEDVETTTVTPKGAAFAVSISDTPDPVPSLAEFEYKVRVKNIGGEASVDTKVVLTPPVGADFVSCRTSLDAKNILRCEQESSGLIIARFDEVKAHRTVTIRLKLRAPDAADPTDIRLHAKATGDETIADSTNEYTTVLPGSGAGSTATLLPSLRSVQLRCGELLNSTFFGADTTLRLEEALGCLGADPALHILASDVEIDLNGKKIVAGDKIAGSMGILVGLGATNVHIDGGGTAGSKGIESFDYCVVIEGNNDGLYIEELRCYGARSVGVEVQSDNVTLRRLKIDKIAHGAGTTLETPGGVGIRAGADNLLIKDSVVRRAAEVGVHAYGVDSDGKHGGAMTIDGNTKNMKIEANAKIGVILEAGPHAIKGALVAGSDVSMNGVVVENGTGSVIDGTVVKNFGADGMLIKPTAIGTQVIRSDVEEVAGDGFVDLGQNTEFRANQATRVRDGFIAAGVNSQFITNRAEHVYRNGFVVRTPNFLEGNKSSENGLHGYLFEGLGSFAESNRAEKNGGSGMLVTGDGNVLEDSKVKENAGIGIEVRGHTNIFNSNSAENNDHEEWHISGLGNVNDGNNKANGDTITAPFENGGTFE